MELLKLIERAPHELPLKFNTYQILKMYLFLQQQTAACAAL